MNIQEIDSTIMSLGVERKQRSEWTGHVGHDRNQSVKMSERMEGFSQEREPI